MANTQYPAVTRSVPEGAGAGVVEAGAAAEDGEVVGGKVGDEAAAPSPPPPTEGETSNSRSTRPHRTGEKQRRRRKKRKGMGKERTLGGHW